MPEPQSIDKFIGLTRRPQADKIENGAHTIFDGANLKDLSIKGNRGRLKQNLTAITDLGKNGLFYYENTSGQRELIYATGDSLYSVPINPVVTGFFSKSIDSQLSTGRSMAVDVNENIYILITGTSTIKKYNKEGVLQSTFTIPSSYLGNAIAVEPLTGIMYVTGTSGITYRLFKLSATGTEVTSVPLLSAIDYLVYSQMRLYTNSTTDIDIRSTDTLSVSSTISGTVGETIKDMSVSEIDGNVYCIYEIGGVYGIKSVTDSGMTVIVTAAFTANGSICVDEFNRIWVALSVATGSTIRVYDVSGNLKEQLGEVGGASNTDFFKTSTMWISRYTNEIILYDYNASGFKGFKFFVFTRW